jgi:hypothetical protein
VSSHKVDDLVRIPGLTGNKREPAVDEIRFLLAEIDDDNLREAFLNSPIAREL